MNLSLFKSCSLRVFMLFVLLHLLVPVGGLYAQIWTPRWDEPYFSLDAGAGTSDVLVDGMSLGLFLEPKFALTPAITIGGKNGIHFSTDNIIALETQAFLRWNFLRLRNPQNPFNIFVQGGAGFLGAFKGNDVHDSRASLLVDATAGVTIPVSPRWHIEPSVRAGFPFIGGVAITAGYKFPLPQKTIQETLLEVIHELEYVEIIRTLPPNEIFKRVLINQVEYVLFAPNISVFNAGLDHGARSLNELVLHHVSQMLKDSPEFRVRIEGHANPVTTDPAENEELLALSYARANEVARLFREAGVDEEQIIVIAYGGTRVVAAQSDHDHWDMNRRVELIIIQLDAE